METKFSFIVSHSIKKPWDAIYAMTYISNGSINSDNNRAISTTYLEIVQSVNEEDKCQVQYLKRSDETTFSLKEGDMDIVDVNTILAVLTNFSVKSTEQYIVNTSFTLDMWRTTLSATMLFFVFYNFWCQLRWKQYLKKKKCWAVHS